MTCVQGSCSTIEYLWSTAVIIILCLIQIPLGLNIWNLWGPANKKVFIDWFVTLASVTGLAILALAILSDGDSSYTRFGPGDDVYFGGWQLDTWPEYSTWFIITLLLGLIDVIHYDNINSYYFHIYVGDKIENTEGLYDDYKDENGKVDISRLFWHMQFVFFFMQIRLIIDVLVINTQIWPILARQLIKEFFIGTMNIKRIQYFASDNLEAKKPLVNTAEMYKIKY